MKRAAVVLALALAAGEACADAIETAGSVGAILLPAAAAATRHYTSDVVAGAAVGIAGREELLPWDFIDTGLTKSALRTRYELALAGPAGGEGA